MSASAGAGESTAVFKGRHMAAILVAFFGVIIGVNLTMATVASRSWTGFVVPNSYVASQEFNGKVAAARRQAALGWEAKLTIIDGVARLEVHDRQGRPVALSAASLTLRSPTTDKADTTVALSKDVGGLAQAVHVADGVWIAEIDVTAEAVAIPWRDTRRLLIENGSAL